MEAYPRDDQHDGPHAGDGGSGPRGGPADDHWSPEAVRRLRGHLGLSQGVLAERIGTKQQTISEWETGASRPRRMSRRLLRLVAEESGFYEPGGESRAAREGEAES